MVKPPALAAAKPPVANATQQNPLPCHGAIMTAVVNPSLFFENGSGTRYAQCTEQKITCAPIRNKQTHVRTILTWLRKFFYAAFLLFLFAHRCADFLFVLFCTCAM